MAVKMDDFELIRILGRGTYGKVLQVRHVTTRQILAMKVLKKPEVIDGEEEANIFFERRALTEIDSAFVVKLMYAFQDPNKLCFVLEYIPGGDLFRRLEVESFLDPPVYTFYAAEIAVALNDLHHAGLIYRDLKPQNVLLDAEGHIRLCDFGVSKFDVRAESFVGTIEYLAPEIILNQVYDKRVDWWAFGCVVYQMVYGKSPFYDAYEEKVYNNVLTQRPEFDPAFYPVVSEATQDFITRLLERDPNKRLCSFAEVKSHPMFADIEWDALLARKSTAPWKPVLKSEDDFSNFDPAATKEKIKDTPVDSELLSLLTNEAQAAFEGFSYSHESQLAAPKPAPLGAFSTSNIESQFETARHEAEHLLDRRHGSQQELSVIAEKDAQRARLLASQAQEEAFVSVRGGGLMLVDTLESSDSERSTINPSPMLSDGSRSTPSQFDEEEEQRAKEREERRLKREREAKEMELEWERKEKEREARRKKREEDRLRFEQEEEERQKAEQQRLEEQRKKFEQEALHAEQRAAQRRQKRRQEDDVDEETERVLKEAEERKRLRAERRKTLFAPAEAVDLSKVEEDPEAAERARRREERRKLLDSVSETADDDAAAERARRREERRKLLESTSENASDEAAAAEAAERARRREERRKMMGISVDATPVVEDIKDVKEPEPVSVVQMAQDVHIQVQVATPPVKSVAESRPMPPPDTAPQRTQSGFVTLFWGPKSISVLRDHFKRMTLFFDAVGMFTYEQDKAELDYATRMASLADHLRGVDAMGLSQAFSSLVAEAQANSDGTRAWVTDRTNVFINPLLVLCSKETVAELKPLFSEADSNFTAQEKRVDKALKSVAKQRQQYERAVSAYSQKQKKVSESKLTKLRIGVTSSRTAYKAALKATKQAQVQHHKTIEDSLRAIERWEVARLAEFRTILFKRCESSRRVNSFIDRAGASVVTAAAAARWRTGESDKADFLVEKPRMDSILRIKDNMNGYFELAVLLSNWMQDRAKIESNYADQLGKHAARCPTLSKLSIAGPLLRIGKLVVQESSMLREIHASLGKGIERGPVRDLAELERSKGDMEKFFSDTEKLEQKLINDLVRLADRERKQREKVEQARAKVEEEIAALGDSPESVGRRVQLRNSWRKFEDKARQTRKQVVAKENEIAIVIPEKFNEARRMEENLLAALRWSMIRLGQLTQQAALKMRNYVNSIPPLVLEMKPDDCVSEIAELLSTGQRKPDVDCSFGLYPGDDVKEVK